MSMFLDRQVFDTRPDFDNIEHGQLDDFKLTQSAIGAGTPWKATTTLRRKLSLPFLLGSKAEWRAFRDFFAALGGSRKGFWLPIWLTDYESYENLQGDSDIKIRDINLAGVFTGGGPFGFLALIDRTQLEPHQIAAITILGNADEQLHLILPIAGSFDVAETVCCGLLYCRLASESIGYRYLSDGVVRCELEFVELPREYVTVHDGSTPIFLYEFTRGSKTWRMTNWPEPLVLDDQCWSPDNIRHGAIRSGVDFLPEDLTLNLATDDPEHPFRYYLQRSGLETMDIQLWETNAETFPFDRAAPLYKGRVGEVQFRGDGEIEARCSSLLRLAEQQLPRMQAQRTCNHRLFDVNCGVDRATFEVVGTLTDVQAEYVEAAAFATAAVMHSDPQWLALGKVAVGEETRMIVGQMSGKVFIDEPFNSATTGQTATAHPGCNKRVSHCVGRFSNIERSAQFTYMPNGNPQFEELLHPKPAGGKKG